MCVLVCVRARVRLHTHMCRCGCIGELLVLAHTENFTVFFHHFPTHFLRQAPSLNPNLPLWLDWLASKPCGFTPSSSPGLELQTCGKLALKWVLGMHKVRSLCLSCKHLTH